MFIPSLSVEYFSRLVFSAAGAAVALVEPTLPYLAIATVMILADCWSAWQLGRRVARRFPHKVKRGTGRFRSGAFARTVATLLKSWALIVVAFYIDRYITGGLPFDLTRIAAGAVCFWQAWSVLENESSCNGARWARLLQRIMVDKTARYFHIDLSDLSR